MKMKLFLVAMATFLLPVADRKVRFHHGALLKYAGL